MDDADEREAFLNAIFESPDDDLPRLVFADWLDERGESDWAELIRCQCQINPSPQMFERERELLDRLYPRSKANESDIFERGFRVERRIVISADQLGDATELRMFALRERPEWYSSPELKIASGLILSGKPIQTLLFLTSADHIDTPSRTHRRDSMQLNQSLKVHILSSRCQLPAFPAGVCDRDDFGNVLAN